ncbi:MAG: DUF6714 family protein [Chloroflexota bacterium]
MQEIKNERKDIIQEVELAFANTTYPGDDKLVVNPNHFEADDVIQDFKSKRWEEVTLELAYKHRLSLPLFTSEAFRFYLPGLLVAALKAPAETEQNPGEILEFIFYSLIPLKNEGNDKTKLAARINGFTSQQKASLAKFIRFFIETNPQYKELYGDTVSTLWKV